MNTLIIIGAGGHGRVVADCAEQTKRYQKIVFLDDCYSQRKKNLHWDIIGSTDSFIHHIDNTDFVVAFGNNKLRGQILEKLLKAKANVVSVIHPTAYISPYSKIGIGVVIFANVVINIGSNIQDGCIINTSASVDHDCVIEPNVHISPGAHIAGGVNIGAYSWVGIGASIIECVTLNENTQIAAGAAVTQSTQANALYAGIPAMFKKIIK